MKKLLIGLTLLASMSSNATEMSTLFSKDYTGIDEKGSACFVSMTTWSNMFVNGENQTDVVIKFEGEKPMKIKVWGLGAEKTKFNLNTRTLRGVNRDTFYESSAPSFKNILVRGRLELTKNAEALKEINLNITNVGITGFPEKFVKTQSRSCSQF